MEMLSNESSCSQFILFIAAVYEDDAVAASEANEESNASGEVMPLSPLGFDAAAIVVVSMSLAFKLN